MTINKMMKAAKARGKYNIRYRDKDGNEVTATLEIKFEKMKVKPAFGLKSRHYPDIEVTVIHAQEIEKSGGRRDPIDWRLVTNLPVKDLHDAIEKL
jgi:hypothetical protein